MLILGQACHMTATKVHICQNLQACFCVSSLCSGSLMNYNLIYIHFLRYYFVDSDVGKYLGRSNLIIDKSVKTTGHVVFFINKRSPIADWLPRYRPNESLPMYRPE